MRQSAPAASSGSTDPFDPGIKYAVQEENHKRNLIFVPQSAPVRIVGTGGDTTAVGENICGSTNGCIAVFSHDVDGDRDDRDHGDHER